MVEYFSNALLKGERGHSRVKVPSEGMTSDEFTDGDLRGDFINRSFLDVSKRIFKTNNLLFEVSSSFSYHNVLDWNMCS